jgi:ankyrin repeat protein
MQHQLTEYPISIPYRALTLSFVRVPLGTQGPYLVAVMMLLDFRSLLDSATILGHTDFMDAIISAILNGDEDALRRQLQRGITPAALNRAYRMPNQVQYVCALGEMMTPLALAAGWGKPQCVALLLEAGATPGASRGERNEEHWKTIPLHWACSTDQVDCALLLLRAPGGAATVDAKLNGGLTPLGAVSLEGHVNSARLLIEHGCNVNEPRDSGASPLYGACQEGHVEMVRLLLSARANINQLRTASGGTPLFAAAGHARPAVIEVLLAARADVTPVAKDGESALSIARRAAGRRGANDARRCVALLEGHYSIEAVDVGDGPPAAALLPVSSAELVSLVRNQQCHRLRELLTNSSSSGSVVAPATLNTPAGKADDPHIEGVRIGGRTPLVAACMLNARFSLEVVTLLLDAKAGIDHRAADAGESFPLMAGLHKQPCVELLLERGANVAQRDREGYTPLLAACEWGLPKAAAALLAHGADPSHGRERGHTPLIAASIRGDAECVRHLLEAGADPTSPELFFEAGVPGRVPREGLDALGWANHLRQQPEAVGRGDYVAVARLLGAFDDFSSTARELEVLTEGELDALTGQVAAAPPQERYAVQQRLIAEYMERVQEARQKQRRADRELLMTLRREFESAPQAVGADKLRPTSLTPVLGGRARIHSLTKAASLNGQEGKIVAYNAGGNRRFGVQLKSGKMIGVLPANLTAVDRPRGWAKCTATSEEVCDALRTAFASIGQDRLVVVDWTPLAADPAIDPAHLHEMGLASKLLLDDPELSGGEPPPPRVYYVQRTAATESFFLTSRELMEAQDGNMAWQAGSCTMPWQVYLAVPGVPEVITPGADFSSEVAYIARLCSGLLATDLTCPICMEPFCAQDNPSQLPCAHFMCTGCMKQLYPVGQTGLKCPVCQRMHTTYQLFEMEGVPGGVAIGEE